jgi:hypothetical protein
MRWLDGRSAGRPCQLDTQLRWGVGEPLSERRLEKKGPAARRRGQVSFCQEGEEQKR